MTRSDDSSARAFWTIGRCQGEIRGSALPPRLRDDVLVETLFSGISRGTELLIFRNEVPASQFKVMRCPFQEGDLPSPVKYGYAAVGRIIDGPEGMGDRPVFVLHPHQDRFVVPASAANLLPDDVPPERAVLAASMETALNGVWDSEIKAGDRVCVIGAGVVGLLVAWLAARSPAVEVIVVDVDPGKATAAAALGLDFRPTPPDRDDFDVVVHASGHPEGLRTALALAGVEATILEMSWFGEKPATLTLGEAFHARRLTIRCSQVSSVSPGQRARWDHGRRLATAIGLLRDPRLDALISGESAFADLPMVMARLADGSLPALCHRIRYRD